VEYNSPHYVFGEIMATYAGPNNKKLILNYSEDNKNLKKVMSQNKDKIKVGDLFDTVDGLIPVVHKFLGDDPDDVYEEVLSEDPPVMFRRTLAQLAESNGVNPDLGGVLLKKQNSNCFVFVPFSSN